MKLLSLLTLFSLPICFASAQPNPEFITGDTAAADPSMCKDNKGTYFVFSTAPGIKIQTSTDRVTWQYAGTVFPPNAYSWTDEYTLTSNGNIWAPDCHYVNGEFMLYYAASSFGSQKSGIFLAKSSTGVSGSWTNEGLVISSQSGDYYNAIDPSLLIVSHSDWRLNLGSFWRGIYQISVSPSNGKRMGSNITHLAQRTTAGGAIEASYIFQHDKYYYLFSSWDLCCRGSSSTYNIRVVRSENASGPYTDQAGVPALKGGGTLVLGTHNSVIGPGGQSVMSDQDGTVLVYHYYTTNIQYSTLGINRLNWTTEWPVVAA